MIKLNGPEFGEAGTRVCVTATNVGAGFSVIATVGEKEIPAKVVIDPKTDTATICFDLPSAEQGGVTVTAANTTGRGTSLVVLSL